VGGFLFLIMRFFKITLCFLLVVITQVSTAQTFAGFDIGLSDNTLKTNISNRPSTALNSKLGYSTELVFAQLINRTFYVKASPNISQKNYGIYRTDSLSGIFTRYNNTYLQIPVKIGLEYGNKIQVFSEIGGYAAYWYDGNISGKVPDIFSVTGNNNQQTFSLTSFNQPYSFNKTDNRFEFGWIASAGVKYKLTSKCQIFLNGSYYQSLSDQEKKNGLNEVPQYNQTFTFSMGCLYLLK
jgi:hypothetical protein